MASETSGADFQVFLSFRGPDTRQGFADCLFYFLVDAGIRVFKDNEAIRPGERIEVILKAINNSTICIPIFSKDYASSKWCLRELSEMVKLQKTILPVFFDVSPDDLKLETPIYRDALTELYGDGDEREEWEMALKEVSRSKLNAQGEQAVKEVGKIKGWELKDIGYGELCRTIVAEVLAKLKVRDRTVTDYLVGIEDQVESVEKLLDIKASGVRYVLIHGIGGIGKTTLAKVVFNRLNSCFEHHSFLSDIRELSESYGVKYLQKQLLADTCHMSREISSSDQGIRAIRDMLPNKKVLIVLDDVDKKEQIENLIPCSSSLKSGSRVVVTTRDERVLMSGLELNYVRELKMKELDIIRALELFSMHAFGLKFPPFEYLHLSKEVISLAGHLPLYLEIAGSYLTRKNKKEWTAYIAELGKVPEKKVQEKLMISYNTLDIRTKQIFLDIACFFVNKEKREAMYMWEACGFHPDSGIEELTSKSMVKVMDGGKLWMHDFMRDLGREIVCLENFTDIGNRSRLWIHEEAMGVLERKEGTRNVQALCLSSDEPSKCFTRKNFKYLINLRFLELSGAKLDGKFEHLLAKLRLLSWHNCPPNLDAKMLNFKNLVVLNLSESDISEDWEGWSQTNMGCNLKVLNLTNCKYFTKTPDWSKFSGLERLILSGCSRLTEFDSSISKMMKLKHLNLTGCRSLPGLPEELCSLDALEEIFMAGGGHAHSFSLPKSIGNLVSLSVLELREVRMKELPDSICNLKKLKQLTLNGCRGINRFPNSFGDLESLVTLDAFLCEDLSELPDSIGNLKQLKVVDLQWTRISHLPRTIGMLEKLEELKINTARKLAGAVPNEINRLSRLKYLDLSLTAIEVLPSLSNLHHLQKLRLLNCNKLVEVPNLPANLTDLEVWSQSVQKISFDISLLNFLVNLWWSCPQVGWPWIEQISAPTHLSRLILGNLGLTNTIPRLSHMNKVSFFRLANCNIRESFECLGVRGMKSLKDLEIYCCTFKELNRDCLPENLEELVVKNCRQLKLLDVSHLTKLKSLSISGCLQIKEIIGLAELKSIQTSRVLIR